MFSKLFFMLFNRTRVNRTRGVKCIWQLLLVVGLSCYCNGHLFAMEAPTFILKNNQWEQLVVPADTSNSSIRALFADDLPADQYGVSWAIYPFDGISNSYTEIGLDDAIPNGAGFWIRQSTGEDVTLDLPDNIPPIPSEGSTACAVTECSSVALPATADRSVFSMLGSGLASDVPASQLRMQTELQGSDCFNGCDLDAAAGYGYISTTLWRWDNDTGSYVDLSEVGIISPWHAFWLNVQPDSSGTNASLLFPVDTITNTSQLEFYGMEWTSDPVPGDFETAVALGVDTIMFDFFGTDPDRWVAELDKAQELGVKVVANYWAGESAWTRTDSGWIIRQDSRNFLNAVADHPALLAVYLLHEPYYNGGDEITTAEQRDLYNQIKAIADVPLYSAFSWSAFEQEKFEAGVCDYCDTWFYPSEFDNPYNEAELNRKLETLLNHFNVATVNSPETKLVWILQAFESSIAGKEMPTYDEMIALASTAIQYQASSGQQVDAVFWYTWRHGSEYQKVLGDYPELQQAVKEVYEDYVQ